MFVTGRIGFDFGVILVEEPLDIKVYPSYLMLHQYELLAMKRQSDRIGDKAYSQSGASYGIRTDKGIRQRMIPDDKLEGKCPPA